MNYKTGTNDKGKGKSRSKKRSQSKREQRNCNKGEKKSLIEEVRKRPVIWDTEHPDYTKGSCNQKMWNEIAKEFSTTVDNVKKRWTSIKNMHKNEIREIQREKRDTKHIGIPFWIKDNFNSGEESATDNDDSEIDDDVSAERLEHKNGKGRKTSKISAQGIFKENPLNRQSQTVDTYDEDYHFLMSFIQPMKRLSIDKKMLFRMRVQEMFNQFSEQKGCTNKEIDANESFESVE